jgi:hypothetical protein
VEAVEIMNNQTMAIVTPTHALGFDAPSRLRAFATKRPGYISVVATKHTWLDGARLAPDSASGNPPA